MKIKIHINLNTIVMPSTVISSISYNSGTHILRVVFVSGMTYDYQEVPEKIYGELKSSRTKGIYLNQHIKPRYSYEKIK